MRVGFLVPQTRCYLVCSSVTFVPCTTGISPESVSGSERLP
jgi:hypothetical protein